MYRAQFDTANMTNRWPFARASNPTYFVCIYITVVKAIPQIALKTPISFISLLV